MKNHEVSLFGNTYQFAGSYSEDMTGSYAGNNIQTFNGVLGDSFGTGFSSPFMGLVITDPITGAMQARTISNGDHEFMIGHSGEDGLGGSYGSDIMLRENTLQLSVNNTTGTVYNFGLNLDADGLTFRNNNTSSSYTFPISDGTANQVLTTNGAGALSWQNAGGGSGWGLTGNAGTDGGLTNFIGTTDAQDFVVKINTLETARFGQDGNVSLGLGALATGGNSSFAQGTATASGKSAIAMGYDGTTASGAASVAIGHTVISSGDFASAFGTNNFARSSAEFTLGFFSTDYTPVGNTVDRLFNIGNGRPGAEHNAYTLWKDGSFAYNDDNFQNDNPGTEQNMFYFNYGNHDGLGVAQTKRAIRLGSAVDDEWDINSANVGNRSIAIGFGNDNTGDIAPIAGGLYSIAIGQGAVASGNLSKAFGYGSVASGHYSTAFGVGSAASGTYSTAFGFNTSAPFLLRNHIWDH